MGHSAADRGDRTDSRMPRTVLGPADAGRDILEQAVESLLPGGGGWHRPLRAAAQQSAPVYGSTFQVVGDRGAQRRQFGVDRFCLTDAHHHRSLGIGKLTEELHA